MGAVVRVVLSGSAKAIAGINGLILIIDRIPAPAPRQSAKKVWTSLQGETADDRIHKARR